MRLGQLAINSVSTRWEFDLDRAKEGLVIAQRYLECFIA